MDRILTLSAVAAALVAGPASADSIRISTAGKSPEQVKSEIRTAANTLCREATDTATLPLEAMAACVSSTVRRANMQFQAIVVARGKGQEVAVR